MSAPIKPGEFHSALHGAASALVDCAMAKHFNSTALTGLLIAYMTSNEEGRTALFVALAERATDRPSLPTGGDA